MTFELEYLTPSDRARLQQPTAADLGEAYVIVQRHEGGIVNLRNVETRAVLQILSFEDNDDVCVAVFPRDEDNIGALYSESAALAAVDVVAVCEAFMSPEGIQGCAIPFNTNDWWERDLPFTSLSPQAVLPVSTQDKDLWDGNTPQEIIDAFLDDGAYSDDIEAIRSALAAGASFSAFTLVPPLVYVTLHRGSVEAIAMLIELGEDISALHDGQTALWHAVTKARYAVADALLAHGARNEEARSSPNFLRWQRRDEAMRIQEAVAAGNTRAVDDYLKGRPPKDASLALCVEAIRSERLVILERLLSYRGALTATSRRRGAAWGLAMEKSDVRYLQALVDHGMYDSVVAQPEDGRSFVYASPEAIAYLCSTGLHAGLDDGFRFIINRSDRSKRPLITAFPDSYFVGLTPEQLTNAILSFEQYAPDRTDKILERHDFAALVHHVFHEAYNQVAYEVVPRIFGVVVAGPPVKYAYLPAEECLNGWRSELTGLLTNLLDDLESRRTEQDATTFEERKSSMNE